MSSTSNSMVWPVIFICVAGQNKSTFRNFTIKNVELNAQGDKTPQCSYSYLADATYENFTLENFALNGVAITGVNAETDAPEQGQFWCTGKTGAIRFVEDSTQPQ